MSTDMADEQSTSGSGEQSASGRGLKLHHLRPAPGAHKAKTRVGRGEASKGKTAGRGTKGTKARNTVRVGFEGGQMPLQRRLPKRGFLAVTIQKTAEIRLGDLRKCDGAAIDVEALKKAGLCPGSVVRAKIILAGSVDQAFTISGIGATKGARAAIEKAGGSIAAVEAPTPNPKLRAAKPQAPAAK